LNVCTKLHMYEVGSRYYFCIYAV